MTTGSINNLTEIRENSFLGRHLIASRDIDVGEIILNEIPLISGPSQITGPICLSCLCSIDEHSSEDCSQCGWPLCRDDACHKTERHAAECNWTTQKRKEKVKIKQFITPHRTYECITTLRCLYQRENNPSVWQKLTSLESHCNKRKGTEKYESDKQITAQFLYRFFKIRSEEFTEKEILKICGIIQINAHEVPLTSPPHVAIYELASMLEHSCTPNSYKSFSNEGNLVIRATQKIKKGENISICYTDPLWSTINRLEHLKLTKYFYCGCKRCQDPTELGTYYSALHCFNKECEGYLVPHLKTGNTENEGLPDPAWKCSECNTTQPKKKVNEVLSNIAHDYSLTDKQNTTSCEIFLSHYEKNRLLHPNHYFLSDVRLKLAQLYGQTVGNDIQHLSNMDLKRKVELCNEALEFATTLYPAEWRIQGVLKFELHASIAEDARRKMINGEIDPDNLKLKLLESKKWLQETIFCLKYEPEALVEGKIVRQAERNLEDLESLLMKIYSQI